MGQVIVRLPLQVSSALSIALLMTGFGYFSQSNLGYSLVFLAISGAILGVGVAKDKHWLQHWALVNARGQGWISVVLGCLALALGAKYRWQQGDSWYLSDIHLFAWVAVGIGTMEELVFRGALIGYLRSYHTAGIVLFSTLSHTAYKVSIFWVNFSPTELRPLLLYTAMFGLVLGYTRVRCNSLYPCLLFHAIFDVWVYGDKAYALWWVW